MEPADDVIEADIPREAANGLIDALVGLGIENVGTIQLQPQTWISRHALEIEQHSGAADADAVVWSEVVERAYEDSAFTWTYISFMIMATLLAAIAVIAVVAGLPERPGCLPSRRPSQAGSSGCSSP